MKALQVSRARPSEDRKSFVRWAFPGLFLQEKDIWNGAGVLLITVLLYGGLVLCIGKPFHPSGNAWAVMIIWLLASAGGWLVERVGLPGPLGMILTGIAVGNINSGHLVKGLPASWSKELRAIALAIIFLRSGLELDLRIFKKVGWVATRLLLVPGILEAFFDGGLAVALFGMPPTFAFALGFILKAVGPALVIQCMFDVQQKRLGTAKSIPATVVAAASFDDMIGITGYTIFIDIAVKGEGNQVWAIMHGPVSVVLGILAGLIAAYLCAFTKLWNNRLKRTAVVLLSALFMKFIFDKYNFTSGGALGSLTLGLCVKELWARGKPGMFAIPETNHEYTRNVEKNVRWLWRFIMMPVLFGLIGNALRFKTLQHSSISKACAIIFAGLAVRMPATFLVMFGGGFTWKERLFFSFAWTPKATVQAALALSPLDAVIAAYKSAPKSAQALRYTQYANETLTTAIFCILIDASIGTLLIRAFAPALLQREPEDNAEAPDAPMVPGLQPPSPRPMVHDPLDRQENEPQQLTAAELARQQELMQHKEQEFAMANEAMLAEFMERIDQIADVVGQQELGHDSSDCAGKLRLAVDNLRDRIAEHDYLKAEEVEGANDFLRATRQEHETLRRRGPGRQPSAASPSGLGKSSEAV
ncbi:TPA: hypothetical protein ACH3X3_007904 [Trebouxia sp. C0006]